MAIRVRGRDAAARRRRYTLGGLATVAVGSVALVWLGRVDDASTAPPMLARGESSVARAGALRARHRPDVGEPALPSARREAIDAVPVPVPPEASRWVADLASDDVPGNALRALRALWNAGPGVAPALERALHGPDRQQRELAATVLWGCEPEHRSPCDRLLAISIEMLRRDTPVDVFRTLAGDPMPRAVRFLARHTRRARARLGRGLWSDDPQQRFLCAFLLAYGRHGAHLADTCRILIGHLGDNHIAGDALMSAHGLDRLGAAALPFVDAARQSADRQARALLALIELDITDPPRDRAALEGRKRIAGGVTGVYFDPAIEFDLSRSRVASW